MKRRLLWSVAAAALAMGSLILWRQFFWQHAVVTAIAVAALVYSVLRTAEQLKETYRRGPDSDRRP